MNGDEWKKLAEDNMKLARLVSRGFKEKWPRWSDDFEAEAYLGLCYAAMEYEGKGKFSTFAGVVIRRTLFDMVSRLHRKMEPIIMEIEEGWKEDRDDVTFDDMLELLTPTQRVIMRAVYYEGYSLGEIAGKIGKDKAQVVRLHRKVIVTLGRIYEAL